MSWAQWYALNHLLVVGKFCFSELAILLVLLFVMLKLLEQQMLTYD
jgi:hypothetical protein